MTSPSLTYRLLADHASVCVACKRAKGDHDAKTPQCGELACRYIEFCPRGAKLFSDYLDAIDADV